eukprot:TRINITY_DN8276_c0_g2_i1.p1 TRINITY_DN8276_c0_g2~~TRINITY_DN8276_c0_g2_i1.p1  ORF type:complete len:832 (+),score=187.80 TRINITY_DN8276_c0_g2_i1:79-2496(+)
MREVSSWRFFLLFLLVLLFSTEINGNDKKNVLSKMEILELREEVREMFIHTYDNYMKNAFPADELHPISCKPRDPKLTPRGQMDETLGNFSLTLVDSLDTLAVMGNFSEFESGMEQLYLTLDFDQDVTISLFETTIRVLGGLISIHLAALEHSNHLSKPYDGRFLDLSVDLADRLIPAFKSPTGIPYSRVNLRRGVIQHESKETCTAGAGTLLLEFGTLSRLTGNQTYNEVASFAMKELYSRRSSINLVGNVLNVDHGTWVHTHSSIGAGADSFYEYLLKGYMLFGDEEYYSMFYTLNSALKRYVKKGGYYLTSDMWGGGTVRSGMIDSLQAFWPGLLVLHGDLEEAKDMHTKLHTIWKQKGFLPEAYNIHLNTAIQGWGGYPLRPEFAESTYFLYLATGDHFYLDVGKRIMSDLQDLMRTDCGFASIADPFTKRLEDRLDSFFLSETLKYLFLLFDEENYYNKGNHIFTTEGHPLSICLISSNSEHPTKCKEDERTNSLGEKSLTSSICPAVNYTSLFPANVWGIETKKYPSEAVESVQNQSFKVIEEEEVGGPILRIKDEPMIGLVFQIAELKTQLNSVLLNVNKPELVKGIYRASAASFGPELGYSGVKGKMIMGIPEDGCRPFYNENQMQGKLVIVKRGGCTFVEKVKRVQEAGGVGVIVGNNQVGLNLSTFTMGGIPDIPSRNQTGIPSLMIGYNEYLSITETIKGNAESSDAEIFAETLVDFPYYSIGPQNAQIKDIILKLNTPIMISGLNENTIQTWLYSEIARFGININEIIGMEAIYNELDMEVLLNKNNFQKQQP